jgi:hypothetical protein
MAIVAGMPIVARIGNVIEPGAAFTVAGMGNIEEPGAVYTGLWGK